MEGGPKKGGPPVGFFNWEILKNWEKRGKNLNSKKKTGGLLKRKTKKKKILKGVH